MFKRGVSNIIVIVLLILVVFSAVGFLSVFIFNLARSNVGNVRSDISIVESEGYTVYDSETELASVHIYRGDDDLNIKGIDVFIDFEGESLKYKIPEKDVLAKNSKKVYKFNVTEKIPERVRVFPILLGFVEFGFAFVSAEDDENVSFSPEAGFREGVVSPEGEIYKPEGYEIPIGQGEPLSLDSWCEGGDLNKDGKMDDADLSAMNSWRRQGRRICNEGNRWCDGSDFDKDGTVTTLDTNRFSQFQTKYFGFQCTETGAIKLISDNWCEGGDLNKDGIVDNFDRDVMARWARKICNEGNRWCDGSDFDNDGKVTTKDRSRFLQLRTKYSGFFCHERGASVLEDNNWCGRTDLNRDHKVNEDDLFIYQMNAGNSGCSLENQWCSWADIDRDGFVGGIDMDLLDVHYPSFNCYGYTCTEKDGLICPQNYVCYEDNLTSSYETDNCCLTFCYDTCRITEAYFTFGTGNPEEDLNAEEGQLVYGIARAENCAGKEFILTLKEQDVFLDDLVFERNVSFREKCQGADLNKDGKTDSTDYMIFERNIWMDCSSGNYWCQGADLNKDGKSDMTDYMIFERNLFEEGCGVEEISFLWTAEYRDELWGDAEFVFTVGNVKSENKVIVPKAEPFEPDETLVYYELCTDEECTNSDDTFDISQSPVYLKIEGGDFDVVLIKPNGDEVSLRFSGGVARIDFDSTGVYEIEVKKNSWKCSHFDESAFEEEEDYEKYEDCLPDTFSFGVIDFNYMRGVMNGSYVLKDYYSVESCYDLQNINSNLNGIYYVANDIDCNGFVFEPIRGEFNGALNGQGFKIMNLKIDKPYEDRVAVIEKIGEQGIVRDIALGDIDVTGNNQVAALAVENRGLIERTAVWVEPEIIHINALNSDAGGLVVYNSGTIKNCYAQINVNSKYNSGGLVSENSGVIENCHSSFSREVYGESYSGQFAALNNGEIRNSFSAGASRTGERKTGFVESNSGTIENCYWLDDECAINGNAICKDNLNYFSDIENEPMDSWDFENVWRETDYWPMLKNFEI